MWDLKTLKKVNDEEVRRKELINAREELERKRRQYEGETFAGRIAQSLGEKDGNVEH